MSDKLNSYLRKIQQSTFWSCFFILLGAAVVCVSIFAVPTMHSLFGGWGIVIAFVPILAVVIPASIVVGGAYDRVHMLAHREMLKEQGETKAQRHATARQAVKNRRRGRYEVV
ncbi:hypothetical protein [Thalassospira aquimaris]|uniref:Uncharacterized protein n=1 Tax=Thalassospira aquimaris TaxID=3037796 RepID=A0ABT6GGH9_9PROT|nr:hypothetical protein [Thalassospira sp. FZY0004]MDG4721168.1 hypothetical protein [Thalassospira sp. FZY0004]